MNNNVVEKTLKSIDNIDRLSDLAAISIYNTSHEAIDKFDVMQEHATPEYVEGEFVQESLLTGVLIGAGIIGVAISAFLIIKKIIESKAKGDPNAASNTVAGVNLLNPDEINKLFDGWNDKYFKNHPDLVAEDVPGADVGELGRYNGILLEAIRGFCDSSANSIIGGVNTLTDDEMRKAIDDLNKEFDSNINMDELVSKTGRVDKNTILQIKAGAEGISKTLREFDAQVTKCITEFRNKEKNNQNSDSDNEENKISEENIKLLEKALKAKANTAGAIMDNFRNKCLNGIAQALDAKVKEAEGQAKAQNNTETSAETENSDKHEKTPETTEGTPKAEPAAAGESEEKPDDYDPTQYIDKNRAEEAAARESTEEFGGDSSDDSAEQSTSEQPENAEKKDETLLSENTEENSHDLDIQYSIGEDGKRKIQVINNGKTTNAGVYWPKEFDESANKLIKASADSGQGIDVFDPVFGMISAINDIYQLGNGNIINYLNFAYSTKNNNEYKNRKYEICKFIAEVLGEPPVDQLPTPPTEPSDEAKDEESPKTKSPSAEKPKSSETPETPKEEEQSETSSEESTSESKPDETTGDEIKRISDTAGLDESKVENIYKILKDNSTPDDVKRAFIIDTIGPMIHMPGFNQKMANDGFKINYDNFKKVAEVANIPFEIELPEISEKDINNIHTIISGADTEETKLAKIADNLMNSTSAEKKEDAAEGDKEQELLSRITNGPTLQAEVAKAVENGIPEDYARDVLTSLTSGNKYGLIEERLKNYDWLNDFKQREAYKKAYNHYNDALLYFTDKGIRDIPELKDELPDPTVEFPNALNDENVMQRVLAQYPVNPETLRKDLEYFQAHIPAENLRYIIKDIIPKYFLENAFTKSFEETVNQIRNDDIKVLNLALINANIAEFKPSPEILKQVTDYINANLEKLKSRLTCTILADALVSGIFDPGMIDSETPKENPSSSTAKEIDTTSNDYELTNNPIMTDEEVKNSDIKPFAPKRFSSKDLNITPEERAAQMGVDDRAQIEGILDSYKLAEKLKAGNKSNEEPKTSETPNEIKDKGFDYDYSQDDESNSVKTFTVPEDVINANPDANMDIVNREYSSLMQLIDNGEDISSTLNSINNLGIYTPATKKAIFDAIKESHPEIDTPAINSDVSTSAEPEVLGSDEPSSNADEIINAADTDINPVDSDIEAHKNAALHHYNITEIAKDPKRGYSSDQLTEDIDKAIAQAQLAKNKGVPPQKAKDVKTALGNIYKKIKGTGLTGLFPNQDKLSALRSAKNYARYKMMENGVANYFSEMVEAEAIYQQLVMECEIAIAREEKLKLIMEQTDSES